VVQPVGAIELRPHRGGVAAPAGDPMSDCAHPVLRLSADGVYCNDPDCNMRIDDDMQPISADPRASLRTVHEIDQAHASAIARVNSLLDILDKWAAQAIDSKADEATDNPMVFYAFVQILSTRVDISELPYMMAALLMQVAKDRVKK